MASRQTPRLAQHGGGMRSPFAAQSARSVSRRLSPIQQRWNDIRANTKATSRAIGPVLAGMKDGIRIDRFTMDLAVIELPQTASDEALVASQPLPPIRLDRNPKE